MFEQVSERIQEQRTKILQKYSPIDMTRVTYETTLIVTPVHCKKPSKSTYKTDINGKTNSAAVQCGTEMKARKVTDTTPEIVVRINSSILET